MTRQELVQLFPSVDRGEVERAIAAAMQQLKVTSDELSATQLVAVLEAMTSNPGPVGVAARFAKVRVLLMPKRSSDRR